MPPKQRHAVYTGHYPDIFKSISPLPYPLIDLFFKQFQTSLQRDDSENAGRLSIIINGPYCC